MPHPKLTYLAPHCEVIDITVVRAIASSIEITGPSVGDYYTGFGDEVIW